MVAIVGSIELVKDSGTVETSSGGQTPIFGGTIPLTKANGDIRALWLHLHNVDTISAANASVNGGIGAIANLSIKDKDNREIKNYLGQQLPLWYWHMTRKVLLNPPATVGAAGVSTNDVYMRLPIGLYRERGPYQISGNFAPYGEIATDITGATAQLQIYQENGPASSMTYDDFRPLTGLTAVANYDISNQIPTSPMSHMALLAHADSDLTAVTVKKGNLAILDQTPIEILEEIANSYDITNTQAGVARPSGYMPLPITPYGYSASDTFKVSFASITSTADPTSGVSLGSAYNPYALLYSYPLPRVVA